MAKIPAVEMDNKRTFVLHIIPEVDDEFLLQLPDLVQENKKSNRRSDANG